MKLKKIAGNLIARLDGKPQNQKGQSLVELTLTMPILFIMLMGMIEIGWLANNYLTLIDVSRSAGRWGSTNNPLETWANGNELRYEYMDCNLVTGTFDNNLANNPSTVWPTDDAPKDLTAYGYTAGSEGDRALQYYDGVACGGVLNNLPPLEFKDDIDDIVISLFYYAVVDDEVKVIGRYPPNTNECAEDAFNDSGLIYYEDVNNDLRDTGPDDVRGYIFRGNHVVSDQRSEDTSRALDCLGSEFSTAEVEEVLNQSLVLPPDNEGTDSESPQIITAEEIAETPNGIIVLVEIFWHHENLLDNIMFNPIFDLLAADSDDGLELHVWSMFPVSGLEPDPARIVVP